MSTLTTDDVRHIAKLARLILTEEEIPTMARELTAILGYVDQLGELDTDDVEPTAQVTGQTTVLRDDVIRTSEADPDALLGCSPLAIVEHQIRVPHAHG